MPWEILCEFNCCGCGPTCVGCCDAMQMVVLSRVPAMRTDVHVVSVRAGLRWPIANFLFWLHIHRLLAFRAWLPRPKRIDSSVLQDI